MAEEHYFPIRHGMANGGHRIRLAEARLTLLEVRAMKHRGDAKDAP